MKGRSSAEKRLVVHAHVPGEQTIVRNDDVVADLAVVPDVHANHQEIIVADFGRASLRAAAMNCAVFADDVFITDIDLGFSFGRISKVLRRSPNDRAVTDKILFADRDVAFDNDVRLNSRYVADTL